MIVLMIVVTPISEDTCLMIRNTHVWIDGRTSVFLNFLQMVGRD